MTDAVPVVVADDPPHTRYTAEVGGQPAGLAAYVLRPGAIAFVHTEVDPAWKGRGVGGSLVRGALDDARARGLAVLPFCPFVRAYIAGHGEYRDLVPAAARGRFGL